MTSPDAPVGWILPAAHAAADGRPILAELFGADYSARAITPQRSDQAPAALRRSLERLRPWDARTRLDLAQWCIADHGDAGAITASTWDDAFAAISARATRAMANGRFAIGLGGDHSVSWPIVTAAAQLARQRGGADTRTGVVQLDIHHDLRSLDRGPSNGTPFRGLLHDGTIRADDLVQVGIHPFANAREVSEFAESQFIRSISLDELRALGPVEAARSALASLRDVDVVHLSVDIDVLDRAFAPGTVAALPGGLDPHRLGVVIETVCADARVGSMDVVEVDPQRDIADSTTLNAALAVFAAVASVARRTTPPT
ncbi:MAG: hutG [Thermoleophilia bacterium]|nr:hutG [Thermoleophilia bacterium]